MTPLQQLGAVAALMALTCSAAVYVAPRSSVEAMDQRLTQHINGDMQKAALQRMWMIEAKYRGQACCAGWNEMDIALWKEAKAEFDRMADEKKKGK